MPFTDQNQLVLGLDVLHVVPVGKMAKLLPLLWASRYLSPWEMLALI
jgi:hypothetical protein